MTAFGSELIFANDSFGSIPAGQTYLCAGHIRCNGWSSRMQTGGQISEITQCIYPLGESESHAAEAHLQKADFIGTLLLGEASE